MRKISLCRRLGLMTLLLGTLGVTHWPSLLDAKGPNPGPRFTMRPMPNLPLIDLYATGMNNNGDVMAYGWLWKTRTALDNPINLTELILNDEDLDIVFSQDVQDVLEAENLLRAEDEQLRFPSGTELRFHAAQINDEGVIAAMFLVRDLTRPPEEDPPLLVVDHVFRYTPAGVHGRAAAEFFDLGLPNEAISGGCEAINLSGFIAGAIGTAAVVWTVPPGQTSPITLEPPLPAEPSTSFVQSYANGLNDYRRRRRDRVLHARPDSSLSLAEERGQHMDTQGPRRPLHPRHDQQQGMGDQQPRACRGRLHRQRTRRDARLPLQGPHDRPGGVHRLSLDSSP